MKIEIKGRYFSDDDRAVLVDFADWCGKKMFSAHMRKRISITIHIISPRAFKTDGIYGTTEVHQDDDWNRPRNFTIKITSRFKILRSLMILAHEMVHVKQHAKQELAYCGRTGNPKWHGKMMINNETDYWDLPWEIEAHGREKGLVYQWAQEKGYYDRAWLKEIF